MRIRHRYHCDDLIVTDKTRDLNSTSSHKQQHNARIDSHDDDIDEHKDDSTKAKRQSADETAMLSRVDQLGEDDDYADEGDDAEDESDSCAQVEPSRTFEQEPCVGNLCPLANVQGVQAEQQQQSISPHQLKKNKNQREHAAPANKGKRSFYWSAKFARVPPS